MAITALQPDTLVSANGFSACTLADLTSAPDTGDGNWCVASGNNVNTDIHVTLPTPAASPTLGAGLQEVRVEVRHNAASGSGLPTARIEVWEAGVQLVAGADIDVISTTPQVVALVWDASLLATADGSAVEVQVFGTKSGGSPSSRSSVDFGGIEWNANYAVVGAALEGAATAVATATGDLTVPVAGASLEGDAASSSEVTGDLSTAIHLEGDATSVTTATGSLDTSVDLEVDATSVTTATGSLDTSVDLEVDATSVTTATGSLDTSVDLEVDALASSEVTGDLSTAVAGASLEGDAASVTTATGSLDTSVDLEVDATSVTTATGSLDTSVDLEVDATSVTTATGSLDTSVDLEVDATSVTTATGSLDTSVDLEVDATSVTTATGSLDTSSAGASLEGDAASSSEVTGELSTAISLEGDAASSSEVTGELSTAVAQVLEGLVPPYIQPIPYGVGGTYVDTPTAIVEPTLKTVRVDPYAVTTAYGEVVTYADSVVSDAVYSAENILTFSETVTSGITVATDVVTFEDVASVIHAASDSLTFSEPTYAQGKDVLSFSDSADYVRNAVDILAFSETARQLGVEAVDELTFTETVSYVRNQHDVLAFSDTAAIVTSAAESLSFSDTAARIFGASNDISFSEPLAIELPLTDQLTWLETVTHGTHLATPEVLIFEQEANWTRAKSVSEDHLLSFYEVGRYTTLHDGVITGSGGTGHLLPTPSEEVAGTLTVGTHSFRVADSYDLETEFGNGTYMNAGSKYSLQLGRPLDLIGDWQLEIRALVGTKQLVTNLLPNPFEAFITDETSLDSEGISLVFLSLDHDDRGAT